MTVETHEALRFPSLGRGLLTQPGPRTGPRAWIVPFYPLRAELRTTRPRYPRRPADRHRILSHPRPPQRP